MRFYKQLSCQKKLKQLCCLFLIGRGKTSLSITTFMTLPGVGLFSNRYEAIILFISSLSRRSATSNRRRFGRNTPISFRHGFNGSSLVNSLRIRATWRSFSSVLSLLWKTYTQILSQLWPRGLCLPFLLPRQMMLMLNCCYFYRSN